MLWVSNINDLYFKNENYNIFLQIASFLCSHFSMLMLIMALFFLSQKISTSVWFWDSFLILWHKKWVKPIIFSDSSIWFCLSFFLSEVNLETVTKFALTHLYTQEKTEPSSPIIVICNELIAKVSPVMTTCSHQVRRLVWINWSICSIASMTNLHTIHNHTMRNVLYLCNIYITCILYILSGLLMYITLCTDMFILNIHIPMSPDLWVQFITWVW